MKMFFNERMWKFMSFEQQLRGNIVAAAKELNDSRVSFAVFAKSKCNPDYWNRTGDGGFQLKEQVLPADAIRDIYLNGRLYAFECATAMVIVLYKAVLDSIVEQQFNTLFTNLYLHSWQYDQDLRLTTLNINRENLPGDILYFKNPDFSPETPQWRGLNVVKMDQKLYYGHGLGITTAENVIAKLNQHRKSGSTTSAYLLPQATYPDFTYLSQFAADPDLASATTIPDTARFRNGIIAKIGYLNYIRL
jgi:protein-glutamine gamma-glutamyltransferase